MEELEALTVACRSLPRTLRTAIRQFVVAAAIQKCFTTYHYMRPDGLYHCQVCRWTRRQMVKRTQPVIPGSYSSRWSWAAARPVFL